MIYARHNPRNAATECTQMRLGLEVEPQLSPTVSSEMHKPANTCSNRGQLQGAIAHVPHTKKPNHHAIDLCYYRTGYITAGCRPSAYHHQRLQLPTMHSTAYSQLPAMVHVSVTRHPAIDMSCCSGFRCFSRFLSLPSAV